MNALVRHDLGDLLMLARAHLASGLNAIRLFEALVNIQYRIVQRFLLLPLLGHIQWKSLLKVYCLDSSEEGFGGDKTAVTLGVVVVVDVVI